LKRYWGDKKALKNRIKPKKIIIRIDFNASEIFFQGQRELLDGLNTSPESSIDLWVDVPMLLISDGI
jgi:hypothetical protein